MWHHFQFNPTTTQNKKTTPMLPKFYFGPSAQDLQDP